jgi:predicted ATPase
LQAAARTQVIAVSHSGALIDAVCRAAHAPATALTAFELVKQFGQTTVAGREAFDQPAWRWPQR